MNFAPAANKRQRSWHDDQTTEEILRLIDSLDNDPISDDDSSGIQLDPCAPHVPPLCLDAQELHGHQPEVGHQPPGIDLFSTYHNMLASPIVLSKTLLAEKPFSLLTNSLSYKFKILSIRITRLQYIPDIVQIKLLLFTNCQQPHWANGEPMLGSFASPAQLSTRRFRNS